MYFIKTLSDILLAEGGLNSKGPIHMTGSCILNTDQTDCFDPSGNKIACAGSGQDAESCRDDANLEHRYEAQGGIVKDLLTGLTWCKNTNPAEFSLSRHEALAFVDRMNAEKNSGSAANNCPCVTPGRIDVSPLPT